MRENEFNAMVKAQLRKQGAICHSYIASNYTVPGVPDMVVWHKKWAGWIECKGTHTKVAQRQYHEINQLNLRRPGTAVVVRLISHGKLETRVSIDGHTECYLEDLLIELEKLVTC